eukprot:1389949-Pyramimonas_sp.AAC.1
MVKLGAEMGRTTAAAKTKSWQVAGWKEARARSSLLNDDTASERHVRWVKSRPSSTAFLVKMRSKCPCSAPAFPRRRPREQSFPSLMSLS